MKGNTCPQTYLVFLRTPIFFHLLALVFYNMSKLFVLTPSRRGKLIIDKPRKISCMKLSHNLSLSLPDIRTLHILSTINIENNQIRHYHSYK